MSAKWKLVTLAVLALLLLIPLGMVRGLIEERQAYRQEALGSIATGSASSQTLAGPVWVLPYRQQFTEVVDEKAGTKRTVWRDGQIRILPDKLAIAGRMRTETLQRGIYHTQRYVNELNLTGQFILPERAGLAADGVYAWGQPYLSVGIEDVRGIRTSPMLQWGGATAAFAPGAQLAALGKGVHARLPAYEGAARTVPFSFRLTLDGMDGFHVLPLGRDTEVSLQSPWPHPGFVGNFLPESRQISEQGFQARWRTSWFASNLNELFEQCAGTRECTAMRAASLGVRLVEPVDVYLQSDRAVKYGFLFVLLTFATFLLTEVLKRVSIHPVQYGLVGVSLAVFFLLLLSFAEQWQFAPAYVLAAAACVLQNGFYATHALGSRARGIGFAALLSGLFALLYVLLRAEDIALLLGAVLLFALLTLVMVLTRRIDWYALGGQDNEA
ncbi:cell envelope integrity protein CreD [Chitinimonas sp. BJYL2]|uniref:cell envelope integrity protein CreD n=1 Tax=Chitinimonas sp. BJYL2 TaxID=2976696 RepID=UPI0022B4041E|nr:cell envelope integrity protein CreD [Chitinimonas sp. BJYL2]